jgi:hypothetical protein
MTSILSSIADTIQARVDARDPLSIPELAGLVAVLDAMSAPLSFESGISHAVAAVRIHAQQIKANAPSMSAQAALATLCGLLEGAGVPDEPDPDARWDLKVGVGVRR